MSHNQRWFIFLASTWLFGRLTVFAALPLGRLVALPLARLAAWPVGHFGRWVSWPFGRWAVLAAWRACVKAGLPDRPDHPDHQKCGGKKRMGWERVTARSQGSRQLDRL